MAKNRDNQGEASASPDAPDAASTDDLDPASVDAMVSEGAPPAPINESSESALPPLSSDEDDEDDCEPDAAVCPKCTAKACSLKCFVAAGCKAEDYAAHLHGPAKAGHSWAKVHSHGDLSHDMVDYKANSWIQLQKKAAHELAASKVISLTGEF